MQLQPLTLSVEISSGNAVRLDTPLGEHLADARRVAVGVYNDRARFGEPVVSVAICRGRRVVDVFDGEWLSDNFDALQAAIDAENE